jgi:hypothetical protein
MPLSVRPLEYRESVQKRVRAEPGNRRSGRQPLQKAREGVPDRPIELRILKHFVGLLNERSVRDDRSEASL